MLIYFRVLRRLVRQCGSCILGALSQMGSARLKHQGRSSKIQEPHALRGYSDEGLCCQR